ncbi:MAG: hypothetical protein EHM17_08025 [Verrucomicrobiaceae bacterium]|nr:MAG: hypothetical protein EHM17_08025 [Verrucomicrobiaceae bacterium]
MIAAMDEGLGQIRAKLREMGQEENTLIFYIGNNRAPLRPGAWNGSINAPLVGEKGMLTDAGVRVPFVAAWPGTLPKGKVYDHPVTALDGVNLIPYLTGKNEAPPHEAMFWRWRSQAAVLEFSWKLVHLGVEGRYLFKVTWPDCELAVNNLIRQHPEIAARLKERFKQWSATNKPPGPPEPHNAAGITFFADHVDKSLPSAGRRSKGEKGHAAAHDDRLCRNARTAIKDGALLITPAAGGPPPFLTHSKLKLEGPVTVKMRLRATGGKGGTIQWRSKGQNDFQSGQSVGFELTAGESRVLADWKSARP